MVKKLSPKDISTRRQVIYWRLMTSLFEMSEKVTNFDSLMTEIVQENDLPLMVMNPTIGVETLIQRYPHLGPMFDELAPDKVELENLEDDWSNVSESDVIDSIDSPEVDFPDTDSPSTDDSDQSDDTHQINDLSSFSPSVDLSSDSQMTQGDSKLILLDEEDIEQFAEPEPLTEKNLVKGILLSKIILNVFGPNASKGVISARDYAQWTKDVGAFERAFGFNPGELRGRGGTSRAGIGAGNGPGGGGRPVSEEELKAGLAAMESDVIKRMAIREILKDNRLAKQLTPSMALMEQLLRDKSNLSGVALANAKRLIQRYIDDLAEILKLQVEQSSVSKPDRTVPPKRVFQNLDLKRTIWKNLPNWDAENERLMVDKLFYHRSATKKLPSRIIVVVDQSGSMVDSMVNCTILASIFAGLPNVEPHLIAYDTQAIDLTKWVHDPFEVLLRTNLGGGTEGCVAMEFVEPKIVQPKNTALIWISDFYDFEDQKLFNYLKAFKESDVRLIPVGSVTSSGYFSINPWFKQRFKELGTPVISGSIKTLIKEIKTFIAFSN